ncbi:TonB-dependent receptor [Methylopila sp. 73B]|uniref:TonB-dependent receptor domain-containing protein n=1 Tax=Methylopila sp. 73B TaxID=1120792 RepID=UPI00056D2089|nr:TonB-dependent receptor [Methylopila sp. 73B]
MSKRAGGRRLVALAGALLATTMGPPSAARAEAPTRAGAETVAIPAGPLTQALNRLAAQAKLLILFDAQLTQGRTTPGVSGQLTAEQALSALLAGTGLRASFAAVDRVVLTTEGTPAPVAASGETGEDAIVLEPITVYGAKTTTNLQDTSASVGVVTADDIADGQIRNLQESYRRLGNVMDAAFASSGFVIRGMSSEGFTPAGAPLGSLYVDGILQTRYSARFGARNLWDAEQVEVYRGPQTTLSGRAATAGAIYVRTKDPTFQPGGEVSATVGNNATIGSAFVLNTPVVQDQIAVRIAGAFERGKTTVDYPSYRHFKNYDDFRTEISQSIRAKVLFEPKELPGTRAILSYSFSNDRPNERLIGAGAGFDLDDERGDWQAFPTYAEFRQIKVHNLGLEASHEITDALKLTSQSGLNYGRTRRLSIDTGTEGLADGIDGMVKDTLFSQELRLNYEHDRLKWVAGVFGSYQHYDSVFGAAIVPYLELAEDFDRKTTNLAAFGEATYEFLPTWHVTLGGRVDYLREKTVQTGANTYPYGGTPVPYDDRAAFDEVNFVPKIGLSKDVAEGHKVGVVYAEGFRTGGYYLDSETQESRYYDPERARNYELFYKGRFLDDRLTLNMNLFFTQYKDQQIEVMPKASEPWRRQTVNAASSRSWGFEIEPTFKVSEQLSVYASLGYLNTKFEDFTHASYGDLSGKPFPEAPEWSLGFGGRYQFENGVYVGGDAKYTSSYLGRLDVGPPDRVDSRIIVNTQAGYRKDNWEINVFAENLLDKRYLTFVERDASPRYAQLGQRRSVGMNVKMKF